MVKATARQPGGQSAGIKRTGSAVAPPFTTGGSGVTAKPSRPPTAFEARLYAVCKCIPPGRVSTYGALAEVLHSAPRACGQVRRYCCISAVFGLEPGWLLRHSHCNFANCCAPHCLCRL